MVYIREAHASDAWQMAVNVRENIVFATPKNYEQKNNLAQMCVIKLGIEFPALVDDFENATEVAYTGWPDRLYVVGRDGRIAYKAKPGPFGFKPDQVARVLSEILPATSD